MITAPAMTKMMPGMTGTIKPIMPTISSKVARAREMKFFHLVDMGIVYHASCIVQHASGRAA